MPTIRYILSVLTGVFLALAIAQSSWAHSRWLIPSHTILSGDPQWVSVDMSISNGIFHPDIPMGGITLSVVEEGNTGSAETMGQLVVLPPDGSDPQPLTMVNLGRKTATAFMLNREGTYELSLEQPPLFLTFYEKADGSRTRAFGKYHQLKARLPEGATLLYTLKMHNTLTTYITRNRPNRSVLEPKGKGLEVIFTGHPNELFVGETTELQLILDGEPLPADVEVMVTPGGTRFRNQRQTRTFKTDTDGTIQVDWQIPGMVLMEVGYEKVVEDDDYTREGFHYYLTLEVNPE